MILGGRNDERGHEVDEREFNDWSMGYIPPAKFSEAFVTKFSGEKDFNPYNMNGDRCHKLLKALRDKKTMNNYVKE